MAQQDQLELLESKVQREQQVLLVLMEQLAPQVQQEFKELMEPRALLAFKDSKVSKDRQELLALQVLMDPQAQRESLAQTDRLDQPEQQD